MADDVRQPRPPREPPDEPPQYTLYRARPRLLDRLRGRRDALGDARGRSLDALRHARTEHRRPAAPGRRRRITVRRALRWVLIWAVAWIALSLVLFLVSAEIQRGNVANEARGMLDGGGFPPFTATNVLVLGSDARAKGMAEPGATIGGPSRSDSIMLLRVGGGHSSRLSILRDTVVNIPGHGPDKINVAYAIGGAGLAIETVKQYLGIQINHVVEVSFENFPRLIDAMGGIDYTGGCVVSRINGGFRNGGFTLRLPKGTHHLNGKQALALARTRHNLCNAREDDRTRAERQQKIISAMKHRLLSPFAFIRLPLIAWNAPKAIKSDMSGPTLLGLFAALGLSGSPPVHILRPSGNVVLPNGGEALTVDDAEKRREVAQFLKG
jgi:LCP family protein required for cell wall assembly